MQLSLVSTNFRNILRRAAIPVRRIRWWWRKEELNVAIERTASEDHRLLFKTVRATDRFPQKHYLRLNFNGTVLFVRGSNHSKHLTICHKTPDGKLEEGVVRHLCDFLFDAFPTRNIRFEVLNAPETVLMPVLHTQLPLRRFREFYFESELSRDEFTYLVRNLRADRVLFRHTGLQKRRNRLEVIKIPLKSEAVSIFNAKWLHFDSLLDMECVSLRADSARFTSQQMHCFIRNWLRGDFPKLKTLSVELDEKWLQYKAFDLEEIIEGVEAVKLEDYEIGIEIRRSDGVKAMVAVTRTTFEFFVNSK